jgi:hypothetical protein
MKKSKNDPCWKGYEMVGTKQKGDRTVPNCVKKNKFKEWMAVNYAPQNEDHLPIANGKMIDEEGAMIKNQLETIERSVEMLRRQIKSDKMQIPAWVQAKVTLATDQITTCANYMAGRDENSKKEEFNSSGHKITEVAWQTKKGKNEKGGLNEKGRKSYEKENPGSDLKAPSKEVGNPRRDSFCARMSGMKKHLTSPETANDPDSRINKSLRAWNC